MIIKVISPLTSIIYSCVIVLTFCHFKKCPNLPVHIKGVRWNGVNLAFVFSPRKYPQGAKKILKRNALLIFSQTKR